MENNTRPPSPIPESPTVTTPPVTDPTPPQAIKKSARLSAKAIIGTVLFLILAGGAAASFTVFKPQIMSLISNPTPTPSPIVTISPTNTPDPTADWKKYEGDGFSFKYPTELNNINGRLRSLDYKLSTGGIELLIEGVEIRVFTNKTSEPSLAKALEKDPLFSQIAKSQKPTTINGKEAIRYEFSYESTQAVSTRFMNNGNLYEIQLAFSNITAKNKYKKTYDQILTTFKFTGSTTVDTSNWKTYISTKYSLKYPPNWNLVDFYTKEKEGIVYFQSNDYADDGGFPHITKGFNIIFTYGTGCVKSYLVLNGPTPLGSYYLKTLDSLKNGYVTENGWEDLSYMFFPDKNTDVCVRMGVPPLDKQNNQPFSSVTFQRNEDIIIKSAASFKVK